MLDMFENLNLGVISSCLKQTDTSFFFNYSLQLFFYYSLQTSFNSVTRDFSDKYYLWGTPTRLFWSKRFFSQFSKANLALQVQTARRYILSCCKEYIVFYNISHKRGMNMSLEIYENYKNRKLNAGKDWTSSKAFNRKPKGHLI